MTFQEFYEQRQVQHIGELAENIYFGIASSGMDFDHFWENVALPIVVTEDYDTEEQLLNKINEGLWDGIKNVGQAIGNAWSGKQDPYAAWMKQQHQNANQQLGRKYDQQQAGLDQQHAQRQAGLGQQQQQYLDQMKPTFQALNRAFADAMKTYVQAAQQHAKQLGNPAGGRIANELAKSLTQYHQKSAQQAVVDRMKKGGSAFDAGQVKQVDRKMLSPDDFMNQYVKQNPVPGSRKAQTPQGGNPVRGSNPRRMQLPNV